MKKCCQTGGYYSGPMHQVGGFYAGPRFQRGGAIRGFAGPEYQLGGKWNFGQFLWRHAKPLLSFLGKKALSTGVGIGQDVIEGRDIKDSAKSRFTQAGKDVAVTALDKVKAKIQGGKGRRRNKRKKTKRKCSLVRKTRRKTARRKSVRRVSRKAKTRKPGRKKRKQNRRTRRRKTSSLKTIFDQ